MLPKILGAVALGATGYGIKKLITDENFRDNVKDKLSDGVMKVYEATEKLEEKMGLNKLTAEEIVDFDALSRRVSKSENENNDDNFEELSYLKIEICRKI